MPEVIFTVKWPDGQTEDCYSPSTIIADFIEEGVDYSLNDFVEKSGRALELASDRVMKKYGFRCTSAEEQISKIIEKSKSFKSEDKVSCLGMK
jgi:uncharacterized repeat protein (TIGR04042 family)